MQKDIIDKLATRSFSLRKITAEDAPLLAEFHKRMALICRKTDIVNHHCVFDSLRQHLKNIDTQAFPPGEFDSVGLWWDPHSGDFILHFKVPDAHQE